jgi:hypothetical protein
MQEILDIAKQKYSDELGWRFTLFELITFAIYLSTFEILISKSPSSLLLLELLSLKLIDFIIWEDSLIANSKVGSLLLSLIATIITVRAYHHVSFFFFQAFSRVSGLRTYVERLLNKEENRPEPHGAKLIYAVNNARKKREHFMKGIASLNGLGLISITLLLVGASSFAHGISAGALSVFVPLLILIGIQWLVFSRYIKKIIPLLVIENRLVGETSNSI